VKVTEDGNAGGVRGGGRCTSLIIDAPMRQLDRDAAVVLYEDILLSHVKRA